MLVVVCGRCWVVVTEGNFFGFVWSAYVIYYIGTS